MATFLKGLAIRGYRGIGSEKQYLVPLQSFNFFIGANNSGKSAVLAFIAEILKDALVFSTRYGAFDDSKANPLDVHRGKIAVSCSAECAVHRDIFIAKVQERFAISAVGSQLFPSALMLVERLIDAISDDLGYVWFPLNLDNSGRKSILYDENAAKTALDQYQWQRLWTEMTKHTGGDLVHHWFPQTMDKMAECQDLSIPTPIFIPALRQVGPTGDNFTDHSGKGLIDRLAEYQHPSFEKRLDRIYFDKINTFLQIVTDDPTVYIEIPHDRRHVLVNMGGQILPLQSLGTGIHEVLMIAAFCTINDNCIVCIEEPEIHLHPLLQRKLISYLRHNTNNQYFIASHSAALIDSSEESVFHVKKLDGQTSIRRTTLKKDRLRICNDLGYKASDILQTNALIWVEGPSDRLYLNKWIKTLSKDFVEGTHYSIMFYGGRLLNHLSADDEEIQEFIDLRAINQHVAVVMDSDKTSARARVNATKRRIIGEFDRGCEGFAWLTQGREIENYIQHHVLQGAVNTITRDYARPGPSDLWSHAYSYFSNKKGKIGGDPRFDVDKVKIARHVVSMDLSVDVLDLRRQVVRLIQMIGRAN